MSPLATKVAEREIIALKQLTTHALKERWRELYKVDPPKKIRSGFLRRAIAYRLQELAHGGLKPQTKRALRRFAKQLRSQKSIFGKNQTAQGKTSTPRRSLSPGTQLMREWNGQLESVDVSESGFVWRSKTYKTLTAVAVAITGTKWSGPKFFGLLPPKKSASVEKVAS